MGRRPRISAPWQLISTDIFGPLPRSKKGNQYILVITDYFSKFVIMVPLSTITAKKIISEIEERVFLLFGVPEYLIADNGVQYGRSRDFRTFLHEYGVKLMPNAYYTPQNNPTERVNRTMKTMLTAFIDEDQRGWEEHLQYIAAACRTSEHLATSQTPYFINFGREMIDDGREHARMRVRRGLAQESEEAEENNEGTSGEEEEDNVQSRLTKLNRLREQVEQHLARAEATARRYYNVRRRDVEYQVGDMVWRREFPTSDTTKHFSVKLARKFRGPFRVKQRLGKNVYTLEDANGVDLGNWHVKDLKSDHSLEDDDLEEEMEDSDNITSAEETDDDRTGLS